MPNETSRAGNPTPGNLPQSLTDRVMARVNDAGLAVDRRAGASRPKSRRSRPAQSDTPPAAVTAAPSQTPEALREKQSLRRVFHDLGHSYRRYRRRTGAPVRPALREAAYKFREDPSLTSLVSVAAFLDELEILTW
jgi:hypothetical protein